MPNSSALTNAILAGLFALFIGFFALQPLIQIILVKLVPIINEPSLIFVSRVLACAVLPVRFACFIYQDSIPARRP